MSFLGGIFGADSNDYNGIANSLTDPNAANYANSQTQPSISALQNVSSGYGSVGQGYAGVGQGYQALGASGVGNSGLAAQQSALGSITNMANGNGPSLARANMQSGLNSTFQNLSNQAMSNQGNSGAGNSQRNLLNAQANAANNVTNQGAVSSVAEQMGALQQQNAAAQGLTQGQLAQGAFQQQNLAGQGSALAGRGNALAGQQSATQAAFGDAQQNTQNQMQLSEDQMAQQNARAGYKAQAANANSSMFKNVLGAVGQIGQTVGAVMTGGGSLMAGSALQGLAGAAGGTGGGGANAGIGSTAGPAPMPAWRSNAAQWQQAGN